MAKSKIREIEEFTERTIKKRNSDIAKLEKQISIDAKEIIQADKKLQSAERLEDFEKAKAEKMHAENSKEMHEMQVNRLKHKPLINNDEFKKMSGDIMEEIKARNEADETRVKELLLELKDIAVLNMEFKRRGNTAVLRLKDEIARSSGVGKVFNDFKLAVFLNQISNNPYFKELTGIKYNAINLQSYMLNHKIKTPESVSKAIKETRKGI